MKIKRLVSLVLAVCLISSFAFAEEEKKGSVLDWFGNVWNDTKSLAGSTWEDTSKWVQETWDTSSEWVTGIWGDASTWVSDQYDAASGTVSNWWVGVFDSVTGAANNAWEWIGNETQSFKDTVSEKYNEVTTSVQKGLSDAGTAVSNVYTELLKTLKLDDIDIGKVLETIREYALKIGIPAVTLALYLLPYLIKLVAESNATGKTIPAIVVAQFLTSIVRKMGVESEDQTQLLVDKLMVLLGI